MRCAGFNLGTEFHLLDHMAPLAELMDMPVFTTDESTDRIARRYYPQVETRLKPDLELELQKIADEFDVLFECKPWGPNVKSLFREIYKKNMCLVSCPHGQSDKGYKTPLLAPHAFQDVVLVYGDLYIQMLKELNIFCANQIVVGNYRLSFYKKNQHFYDDLAEQEIFSKLKRNNQTLLYAPTWKDADAASSFFHYGTSVMSQLPACWNLIIKVHPLLEQRDPAQFYAIAAYAEKRDNIVLINEFPSVYPILARTDIYLGDFSSVGYDYLFFQRPLFFLPTKETARLHSCGKILNSDTNFYTQMEKSTCFQEAQKKLYRFAFGNEPPVKNDMISHIERVR